MESPEEAANFEIFHDLLTHPLVEKLSSKHTTEPKKQKVRTGKKRCQVVQETVEKTGEEFANDVKALKDFIDYISTEVFTSLPEDLRDLTYYKYRDTPSLQSRYSVPMPSSAASSILQSLPPSVADTLNTYGLLPSSSTGPLLTPAELIHPVLAAYLQQITTPPLPPSLTKDFAEGCEICAREQLNLTYHHLIPRSVHEKVIRRAWHTKDELNNVAWLCGACHRFVHRLASNEELARNLFTVEKLLEREETQRWRMWIGGVRWKKK